MYNFSEYGGGAGGGDMENEDLGGKRKRGVASKTWLKTLKLSLRLYTNNFREDDRNAQYIRISGSIAYPFNPLKHGRFWTDISKCS